MKSICLLTLLLGLSLLFGCAPVEQSQEYGEIPLKVKGTPVDDVELDEGRFKVERADLAFGPLYLCSGLQAGHLCETARLEYLDSQVIDLLNEQEVSLGKLTGMSGLVRSWMYDLGIVSTFTQSRPVVLESAKELDGHSFVLEGLLTFQNREIPVKISVVMSQTESTEQGVPLVRKSQSEFFEYSITKKEVLGQNQKAMLVQFPFDEWIQILNFSRDLTEEKLDELCPSNDSCTPWIIEEDSSIFQQIKTTLLTQMRPQFEYQ